MLNEGFKELETESGCYDENGTFTQYDGIFARSRLEEVVLPGTLADIRGPVFENCDKLQTVWVRDGCTADVRRSVGEFIIIVPIKADDISLRDFLLEKRVTIP